MFDPVTTSILPNLVIALPDAVSKAPKRVIFDPEVTSKAPNLVIALPDAVSNADKRVMFEPDVTSNAPNLVIAEPLAVFNEPVVDSIDAVIALIDDILAADEVMLETSILLTVNEPVNMGLCITIVVFYINILLSLRMSYMC
jgi:hypothetical protein